jgi:hypothetical protein
MTLGDANIVVAHFLPRHQDRGAGTTNQVFQTSLSNVRGDPAR